MSVDLMSVDLMSVDLMSVDLMSVDLMSVDLMSVDLMSGHRSGSDIDPLGLDIGVDGYGTSQTDKKAVILAVWL